MILYSIDVFSVLLFYFDFVFYSYFHFFVYSFIGVGSMLRIFGSDVLHTWTLGFVEACVGFSLQMIRYIGWSNVDRTYSQSPKILLEIIKKFPAYNSLQPVKGHVRFCDIFELCLAESSKKVDNPRNTTNILKMRESSKLFHALIQIYFALTDERLLPSDLNWARKVGFCEPFFSPRQVLINALNAVLEVHFYLKCGCLTESQLTCMQMLIANAQGHMLVLDVVRKRIVEKAITTKEKYEDIPVHRIGLMRNVKFEMLSHFAESMRECGCDNNFRDTEHGERLMKLCKLLFADTSARYHTVLRDMLTKFLHLEYMAIAHKGLVESNVAASIPVDVSKAHNVSVLLTSSDSFDFRTNKSYKRQVIVYRSTGFKPEKNNAAWMVHPMLQLVVFCFYYYYYMSLMTALIKLLLFSLGQC